MSDKLYPVYQDRDKDGNIIAAAVPEGGGLLAVSGPLLDAIIRADANFGDSLHGLLLLLGAESAESFEIVIRSSEKRLSGKSKAKKASA